MLQPRPGVVIEMNDEMKAAEAAINRRKLRNQVTTERLNELARQEGWYALIPRHLVYALTMAKVAAGDKHSIVEIFSESLRELAAADDKLQLVLPEVLAITELNGVERVLTAQVANAVDEEGKEGIDPDVILVSVPKS